jgi:aspartate-semialdehyde dehydrogenase
MRIKLDENLSMNTSRNDSRAWRVAILGATGMVGRTMLTCLASSSIRVRELVLLASPHSAGTVLNFRGSDVPVEPVSAELFRGIDLALFSAGAAASGKWAPVACAAGAPVVDNSSRWRMDPAVPLVVPEVNAHALPPRRAAREDGGAQGALIANPNCATIQLVVALEPIRAAFGLERVVLATYQSASGKGQTGLQALAEERNEGRAHSAAFPAPLLGNVIPQCDIFLDDGYTREEEKTILETRKILGMPGLAVHPTCVRVPVDVGHAEAVYLETSRPATAAAVRAVLALAPGIVLVGDSETPPFPTPLAAAGTDPVWVGRVRTDRCEPRGVHLWIVADNLRKGAATNAVQIAEAWWEREG